MERRLPERLETERLIIRTAKPGDGEVVNKAVIDSLERLKPWLEWATPTPSLEQSEDSCCAAYQRYLRNEDLRALLFLRESGELVGVSGLHKINWKTGSFEIGYWGHIDHAGKGYITESVKALSDYAINELGARCVYIMVDERNESSCKVAEKAGFSYEGTLRNERLNHFGELRNMKYFSKVPKT